MAVVLLAIAVSVVGESAGTALPVCPDDDENNSIGSAEPIAGLVEHRSICGDEHDWFSVAVEPGDLLAIDLFVEMGPGEIDMALRDSGGVELDSVATSESTKSIRHTVTSAATLLIDVFERSGTADGQYSLAVSAGPPGACGENEDAFEPNDVRADATPLGDGTPRTAWLCDRPDVYVVNVPPSSPDPLTVTLTVDGDAGDLDIGLFDDAGTFLDGSTGTSEEEEITLAAPVDAGQYFVEVFGYRGGSGAYELAAAGVSGLGSIEGTVTNRRDGDLEGISVQLHADASEQVVASSVTDESGGYGFDQLTALPGDYRLFFTDPQTTPAYVDEWFDDAASHGEATSVGAVAWETVVVDARLASIIPYAGFSDIGTGHAFRVPIDWVAFMGIVAGFPDNTFRGTDSVNRQQSARWLWNLMDSPTGAPSNTFSDVTAGNPFRLGIDWVSDQGIITGYPDNTFRGTEAALRQQAVSWLYNLVGAPDVTSLPAHGFSDVSGSAWYGDALKWAAHHGIVAGYPDNTFRPTNELNRQQMAFWMHNLASLEELWDEIDPIPSTVLF